MNFTPIIAAGLFDSPWVVIAIVVASSIANWLSKRRAEKNGEVPPSGEQPSAPPDWEERLRRLLGEEMPPAAPPPVIRPAGSSNSAPPPLRPARQPATSTRLRRPPPVEVAPVIGPQSVKEASAEIQETVSRYELSEMAVKSMLRPAVARAPRRTTGMTAALRRPSAARQAFIASLVFGPPKGLES
ncbi:MAG: hypothetical protein QM813_13385 [Verrucomicrobiota bacterium]